MDEKIAKWQRVSLVKAIERLCNEMPDVDKHFLAERLLRCGSTGGPAPLQLTDFLPLETI